MLKFLSLFFSCWLIASGSICQSPPADFPDTPTITGESVGKARIGMPVAKLKELLQRLYVFDACMHLLAYGLSMIPMLNPVAWW